MIELVVVMVIVSLLATLAMLSFGGTMDRYRLSCAAETVEMFDAHARRDASRLRKPIQATIERDRNRLVIRSRGEDTLFPLPRGVEIKQIRVRRRVTTGRDFEIQFNNEGSSPTYALELARGTMSRWLVVLGISGQVIALDNEGEVNAILSL
jgi:Tfp pilus assembly protein FimT